MAGGSMERCDSAYGKRIKKRLVDLNMTQVELAQQLGISKQYMRRIISGEIAYSRMTFSTEACIAARRLRVVSSISGRRRSGCAGA